MNTLFEMPECKSPRLLWIEKHGLKITSTGLHDIEECPETGMDVYPFYAAGKGVCGRGKTEDEALVEWAKLTQIKLWNEE